MEVQRRTSRRNSCTKAVLKALREQSSVVHSEGFTAFCASLCSMSGQASTAFAVDWCDLTLQLEFFAFAQ